MGQGINALSGLFSSSRPDSHMTGDKVRQSFMEFFAGKGHTYVHSSPIVILDDPTLLFVNAGMNQFKSVFTGKAGPDSQFGRLKRAYNSQKCIRAGGKHNDLDDVGKDLYHHTFFEMLGNWSFGDYFKEEAIKLAMEYLTETLFLDPRNLYATYFEGDAELGLPPDTEARDLWITYLGQDHVIPGSFDDNFWEMGDVGPCGPCSELHYDRLETKGQVAELVNKGDPNVIELWNIVFITYNREVDGSLTPLPNKHVDTGMGLERLVSVVQGKLSNYDTDIFQSIFEEIHKLSGCNQRYAGKVGDEDVDKIDQAYRVVADHCRTLVIAIADGIAPSNTGRGYVIRRILRRAVRFAFEILHAPRGFMPKLAGSLAHMMAGTFPEIGDRINLVTDTIDVEESQFAITMKKGRRYLDKFVSEHMSSVDGKETNEKFVLPGKVVWRLYDTFGFPFDLTSILCEERGIVLDVEGFEAARKTALNLSRSTGSSDGSSPSSAETASDNGKLAALKDQTEWFVKDLHLREVPTTDDSLKYTIRHRLENTISAAYRFSCKQANVLAIFDESGPIDEAKEDRKYSYAVILDRTCFYSSSGGQVGDAGALDNKECECIVTNAWSSCGYVFHLVDVVAGKLKVSSEVHCLLDGEVRTDTMANHTATHLLNFALREQLGPTAQQKGSLVCRDRLRFDVSIQKPITVDDLTSIEQMCRKCIEADVPVETTVMPFQEAFRIPGVRVLSEEHYPRMVRVVSIGRIDLAEGDEYNDPLQPERRREGVPFKAASVELCGGTHVDRTSHLQYFCITESDPLAKGVRRITAVTRLSAETAISSGEKLHKIISEASDQLGSVVDEASAVRVGNYFLELEGYMREWVIPHVKREELKIIMASLRSTLTGKIKAVAAERSRTAFRFIESKLHLEGCGLDGSSPAVQAKQPANYSALVALINVGADRKALSSLANEVRALVPHMSVMLFSHTTRVEDINSTRTICQASVPRDNSRSGDLKAREWVEVISRGVDGKHGGSASSAQMRTSEYLDMSPILMIAASTAEAMIGCAEHDVLVIDQSGQYDAQLDNGHNCKQESPSC